MTQPTILVSSAGTGKTTTLLEHMEQALRESRPDQIMFTTFTNAGASEIAHRAADKFPEYTEADFKFFRTLHSIAYRNIPNKKMVKATDKANFGRIAKYPISGGFVQNTSDGSYRAGALPGDILMTLSELWRTRMCKPETIIQEQTASTFSVDELVKLTKLYRNFRENLGKYDFCDQLETFYRLLQSGGASLPVRHVFVDEAQDLSALQWAIIQQVAERSETFVVAGDDKQSIYQFSGADPEELIAMEGNRKILGVSYRLSADVLDMSEEIAGRLQKKQDYTVTTRPDASKGSVSRIRDIGECHLSEGSWFLLVRNRFMMGMIEERLMALGIPYTSDNPYGVLTEPLLRAIRTWKEMCNGFQCLGVDLKTVAKYLPARKAIKHGFKQRWDTMGDDEMFTFDQLQEEYGLETKRPWDAVFALPDSVREDIQTMDKRGLLDQVPSVRVSTIHGVKGQEADNVIIFPDITLQTARSLNKNPDSEHRVFYVAVTRARKHLFIHEPFTKNYYTL